MSTQPPILPHIRVDKYSFEDRDNFVRNLVTILTGSGGTAGMAPEDWPETPLTPSAAGRPPVLTVDEVKMHLRIEPVITEEDEYLTDLEMAARLHCENILRREIDAAVGENVKWAMRFLIGHWYRNREAVAAGAMTPVPMAVESLLAPERDYPFGML